MKISNLIRLAVFLLAVAACAVYPALRINACENPGIPPQTFRFRVTGHAPSDFFRGRYLALRALPDTLIIKNRNFSVPNARYAVLSTDPEGYACVTDIVEEKPAKGFFVPIDYYGANNVWKNGKTTKVKAHSFQLPFRRFYMNEDLTSRAEKIMFDRESKSVKAILVRVYSDGAWVIDDLLVDGEPIRKILAK